MSDDESICGSAALRPASKDGDVPSPILYPEGDRGAPVAPPEGRGKRKRAGRIKGPHTLFLKGDGLRLSTTAMERTYPCHHAKTPRLHPSNLRFPGQLLQPCSDGTDSTSNAVACLVVQFCSCKLPFGAHYLRVHRFVLRTPQHSCSIVED